MRRIEIGRLGKPHGLEGGLKFRGEPLVGQASKIYLEGLGYRGVEEAYWVSDELVLHLAGITNRESAEELVGVPVYLDESDLPKLEPGSYYHFQLIGRPVFVDGKAWGEVAGVEPAGVQDLLIIKPSGESLRAGKTRYVPLQAPYVKVKDEGIYIEPIPGLLD